MIALALKGITMTIEVWEIIRRKKHTRTQGRRGGIDRRRYKKKGSSRWEIGNE